MALIINGEHIEDTEIERVREQFVMQHASDTREPEWEAKGLDLDAFSKDMLIAQVLTRQEAKQRDLKVHQKEFERQFNEMKETHGGEQEFRQFLKQSGLSESQVKDELKLSLQVDELLNDICGELTEPSPEELEQYYEAHNDWFMVPEQIRVSHIVKHVQGNVLDIQAAQNDLKSVLDRVEQGTKFETLARMHSDCPESGGDLGYFARGAMVPEFEDIVFNMQVGEISDIFETPFGLHIAKLLDRVPSSTRAFEEVREDVTAALCGERENAVIDAFTSKLREKAVIEEV